jgi:CubicO group peptidase (beta-lactamase class C family)
MLNIPQLEQRILEGMDAARVPGLAIAVIQGDEIIYKRGFGVTSVETMQPITPETLFRVGSISKPITATIITNHLDKRFFSLDTPVNQYVPDIRIGTQGAEQHITLRTLLSHTAGVHNDLFYEPSIHPGIVNELRNEEIEQAPGLAYRYSNVGISLAIQIFIKGIKNQLADNSGSFLTDELLLRTFRTPTAEFTFDPLKAMTYSLALPHILNHENQVIVMRPFVDNSAMHACGFVMSSIIGLANFAIMHLNEGKFKNNQILKPETIAEMHRPHVDRLTADNVGYGLGFRSYDYKGVRLVGHNGAISKYGGWLWLCPAERVGVVMLVNRAPQFWAHGTAIVQGIFDEMLDLQSTPIPKQPSQGVAPNSERGIKEFIHYTGDFLGHEDGLVQLRVENDVLQVSHNLKEWKPLYPIRESVFASEDRKISVGFINEDMLYFKGNLCKRFTYDPQADFDMRWTAGRYLHDIDMLRFRRDNAGAVLVWSQDDQQEYPCLMVGENLLASSIGTFDFAKKLLFQNAFQFKWHPLE